MRITYLGSLESIVHVPHRLKPHHDRLAFHEHVVLNVDQHCKGCGLYCSCLEFTGVQTGLDVLYGVQRGHHVLLDLSARPIGEFTL